MSDILVYVLKIFAYFILVLLLYFFAKFIQKCELTHNFNKKNVLIIIVSILIISILFGIYSVVCTKYPYESDRLNYAFRFQDDRFLESVKTVESPGLYYLEIVLHLFSHDPNILFFTCTFLFVSISLVSYILKDHKKPKELLLLGLSPFYFIYGFIALKQSISIALSFLAYSASTRNKKVLAIISILLAFLFHETALVAILFYIIYVLSKKRKFCLSYLICLALLLLFFPRIANLFTHMLLNIFPTSATQLRAYISASGDFKISYNSLTIFKYIPFYIIALYAIMNRKKMISIKNFSQKTVLFISGCTVMLLSAYMYWMFRFSLYIYPFMISFFVEILDNIGDEKLKKHIYSIILILFFILTLVTLIKYFFNYGGF